MKSSFNRSVFLARLYGLGLMLAIVPATSALAILPMLAEMYQFDFLPSLNRGDSYS